MHRYIVRVIQYSEPQVCELGLKDSGITQYGIEASKFTGRLYLVISESA